MSHQDEPVERELKFPCSDLNGLRERLAELGAERVAPAGFEENFLFDRDGELESEGLLLRLRTDAQGARLTFKGPGRFEGETKVRLELETEVGDAEAARRILESLGYRATRRYQKYREEWRLGGVVVALDRTPIGEFAEFEGEGAEKVARRCRFDLRTAERRTYLQLYSAHRKGHPGAPADMIFP